jgi:hypothetical protein
MAKADTAMLATGTVDLPEWGPKMNALPNDRWRNFVMALYDEEAPRKKDGLFLYAIRKAGFGTATSTANSLSVQAHRVCYDARTQKAIAEYSIAVVRAGLAPDVVKGIRNVVNDPNHRDFGRVLMGVYDRLDPLLTTHKVVVEDSRPASPENIAKVLERIDELAARAGLLPAPVIEGDFEIVEGSDPA